MDGIELHVVTYQPKKSTGLEITMYFEPETFHHVRTVYLETQGVGISAASLASSMPPSTKKTLTHLSGQDVASARRQPNTWTIEEQFSNFTTVDGLTLPIHYDLRFQERLQNNFVKTVEWDITTTRVLNNISVDARNFQVE